MEEAAYRRHLEGASGRGIIGGGIMEEASCRRHLEEASWRRYHGGVIMEKASWRRHHGAGGGILEKASTVGFPP